MVLSEKSITSTAAIGISRSSVQLGRLGMCMLGRSNGLQLLNETCDLRGWSLLENALRSIPEGATDTAKRNSL